MRMIVASLVLSFSSWKLAAQPPKVVRPQTSSVFSHFEYLSAIIASLADSHLALTDMQGKANDPSIVERMTANQNCAIELDIVARRLKEFTSAPVENVRLSASGSITAYQAIRRALALQLGLLEKVDAAKSVEDLSGMSRAI